jgi:glycosyltransferase involved in cell wall biosynthesis
MSRRLVSIVIPVFNEELGLEALVGRLLPVMQDAGHDLEVIFVDDGSRDGTLASLRALQARDGRLKALSFSRNFGKERAVAAGLAYARGDAVIVMDADLQHPPEVLPLMLAKWGEGHQVVYGQRRDRETDGPVRRLLSEWFYRLFKVLARTDLPRGAGDFRLLDRRAVDALNRFGERARFNNGLYAWIGFRSVGVPYDVGERAVGRSKWSPRKLFAFALDGLTSFSNMPLKVWSLLGLVISLAAFAYALVFLVKTLVFGIDVPGFPTLAISMMLLAGVQLISLGVLGEYLGRVYEEVKARPLYIVAEEIGLEPPAQEPARPAKAGDGPRPATVREPAAR